MKYQSFLFRCLLLVLLTGFLASCDQSKKTKFSVEDVPDPKKSGGGYVSNPDHLISDAAVTELNEKLSVLDNAGKAQVAVVILHSIGDNESRDFAHKLFNYWKIGNKEKNNGLLVLMVEDARRLEFETGYGLEADMPDIICFRIQQEYMIPRIKEHNYDAAFTDGIKSVASLFNNGNYAYDKLPDIAPPDASMMAANSPEVPGGGAYAVADTPLAASDIPDVAGVDMATATAPADAIDVAPQSFAQTDIPTNSASNNYTGDFSIPSVIFWLFASAAMMHVFFGKKVKRKESDMDAEPLKMSAIPNEFLRPRWTGLIIIHAVAFYIIYYITTKRHTDVGFLKVFLIYYLVWLAFMHVAVLLIAVRSAMMLRNDDRHLKWLRLEVLRRDLRIAGYVFPVPYLWFYLKWLQYRLNHLRNDVYDCPQCSHPMHKLDETADNTYLDKGQVMEEKLESVDYDVWRCDTCNTQTVLNYTNMRSGLTDCPSCKHKTYKCKKTVTKQRATTSSQGWGIREYVCAFCAYAHDYQFIIPKISKSSSSSSGSSFSSSSSSSSSWGGGSSGGGGASSSW
ncbi:TPM domain-containing protein [Chitinophaga sp.]|uniref:TPM domain-containing protein n=1 Tax=Chitinophaga sp. TaxID=1869181 RepID=UPI002D09ECE5|nr:TPM domain-containing protein [Chitinophaga sp.]HWV66447.1 TPM domain-containing protein [Chitinophaga sp.]